MLWISCSGATALIWTLSLSLMMLLVPTVHGYKELTKNQLKQLHQKSQPKDSLGIYNATGLIQPILIERVPGTDGSHKVQEFITGIFKELKTWDIKTDRFDAPTPLDDDEYVQFTNLIFTREPPKYKPGESKRLILAAHFDSKREPQGFVGAVDSAVPCALILHTIKTLDSMITASWESGEYELDIAIQVVFFDGEEALVSWTDRDSIYGARHLANVWQRANKIKDIDTLVLFDILGAKDPVVPSYFEETDQLQIKLADVEKRINKNKLTYLPQGHQTFFPSPSQYRYQGVMADDHVPYLRRGVPVLHVIPSNFPPQWHTIDDNAENLDQDTIYEWSSLITTFVAEYLELGSVDFIKRDL